MAALLEVELQGAAQLRALLERVDEALDPESVLDEAGARVLDLVRKRFLDQVNPDGSAWEPSQAAKDRAAANEGGGTLFDTGSMWRSIDLFAGGQRERVVAFDPGARNRRTGVPVVDYAGFAQDGPPERTVMGLALEDVQSVEFILQRRFEEAARG